jgi:hypothetical protein
MFFFISPLRRTCITYLKREQGQTQAIDFEQNAIERRLIEQRSAERRFARCLWENLKILKPFLPGWVQMFFDTDVASYVERLPPFVEHAWSIKRQRVSCLHLIGWL